MIEQVFQLPAAARERAVEALRKFALSALPGKDLEAVIRQKRNRRSDEQNRYWWGVVVATFCQRLEGWSPEDVHTYLCGEHFGWERIEGLGKVRLRPVRRSSKLSKAEFAELVAKAQQIGAEHGIYIPDPNEQP